MRSIRFKDDLYFDESFGVWRHISTAASCPPVEIEHILGERAARRYEKQLTAPDRVQGLLLARFLATWAWVPRWR